MTRHHVADDEFELSDPSRLPKKPVVSVFMLAYNHGAYLAEAIEGVLKQETDFPIELLIGEDCSTDDTREIALRYQRERPDVIRVITANSNIGGWKNYRRLLVASRGDFLAHHDGDDYWLPGKLQRQIALLRKNPDCVAVYTNALTVTEGGNLVGFFNDVGDQRIDLAAMLRRGNFLNTSSMVFRAASRDSVLDIDGPFLDYRVHLRLARSGFLMQLAAPLTVYRINSRGSMVSRSNDLVRIFYWEAILDVPRDLVTDDDFAHGIADFLRRVAFRSLRMQRWALVREWIPLVFAASPYGTIKTMFLVIAAIFRSVWIEVIGKHRRGPDGRHVTVLYRR